MSGPATSFIAVVLDTAVEAEDAMSVVRGLDAKNVSVRDAVIVVCTESGRIELQQTREIAAGEGIVAGGAAGLVGGILLGTPVGGALLGLAGGAVFGMHDTGLPDARLRKLGEDLRPGQAALCVLVDAAGLARTRDVLTSYGPVLEVELSADSGP